jgi:hypothetical protein
MRNPLGGFATVLKVKASEMSPLRRLGIGPDGKPEITTLQTTESVQVCVELDTCSLLDAYFEDGTNQQRFYVLSLDDVVSANIGLYNGEAWHIWVWMWEDEQEAEEAWSKVPATLEPGKLLEQLTQKIDGFIRDAKGSTKSKESKLILDITSDLSRLGWEMTILDYTKDEVARAYGLSKKAQEQRKIGQKQKAWWELWRK